MHNPNLGVTSLTTTRPYSLPPCKHIPGYQRIVKTSEIARGNFLPKARGPSEDPTQAARYVIDQVGAPKTQYYYLSLQSLPPQNTPLLVRCRT